MSPGQSGEILYLVIKSDTAGMEEAINYSMETLDTGNVRVEVVYSGTGGISKTDLLMAETSGKLIYGFNVDILPGIGKTAAEKGIEIRLHNVIYKLLDDIKFIAGAMAGSEVKENIKGRAEVIALFSGGRRGIILGCEVSEGVLSLGSKFRIISGPGVVYSGTVDSLHIESRAVNKAVVGQQVGLKLFGYKDVKKGDLIECFEKPPAAHKWHPVGTVRDLRTNA